MSVIHFKWVQCTVCQLYLNTTALKKKIQYYKVISLQLIKINEKKKKASLQITSTSMKRKEHKEVFLLTEISDGGGNQKFSIFLRFFNF